MTFFCDLRAVNAWLIVAFISFALERGAEADAADGILKSKPGLNSLVVEAMAARATIVAGQFDYKMVNVKGRGGDVMSIQEGMYGFDERQDRSIHAYKQVLTEHAADQNPSGAAIGGGIVDQTDAGLQVTGGGVFSPEMSFLFPPQGGRGFAKRLDTRRNHQYLTPFNFRAFGFAFYGDFLKGSSFDKVFANYLAVADSMIPEVVPGKLPKEMMPAVKNARYFNFGGCLLCLESDRDFWVTRARYTMPKYKKSGDGKLEKDGVQVHSDCIVELTQMNGYWVPKRTIYTHQDGKLIIDLTWVSVNPKEGSIDFSPEVVIGRINKPLR